MKVLIVVTHLLGTGHLSRALTLARAFQAQGHTVRVASGGFPAPQLQSDDINLCQIAPLRSDGTDFRRLLGREGTPADTNYMTRRRTELCDQVRGFQPRIIITELFPFGRRALRDEFMSLIDAAEALPRPPILLSSVRDILAPPSKPERAVLTEDLLTQFYHGVLVHSDPAVIDLGASWPVKASMQPLLHYTGFIAPPAPSAHPDGTGRDEILVSAGGGAVGHDLFRAAVDAARAMPDPTWRLLVGGRDVIDALNRDAPPSNVLIEPPRADFRAMLPLAAASISMCGYNTTMDLLQTGIPAAIIPFDAGGEVEQGLRANRLRTLPGIEVLSASELTGDRLIDALRTLLKGPRRAPAGFHFDGAAQSVKTACALAEGVT